MTDQELIKRLRASRVVWQGGKSYPTDAETAAADRIEELVKERDEARIAINQIGEAMGVLGIVQCLDDIVAEAKKRFAKLTKAMAGLRKIADHKHFSLDQGWIQNTEARIASAVLAELEKTE